MKTPKEIIADIGWLHNEDTGRIPQRIVISLMEEYSRLKSQEDNDTLKAENERLKATLVSERQMRSDMQMEFKQDRAGLQSDNEAKDKRIKELERNYTEAIASIENLNDCLDKMWNDQNKVANSETHRHAITKAQQISKQPIDKWYGDPILNPS